MKTGKVSGIFWSIDSEEYELETEFETSCDEWEE
jgi:hypothetical protein